MKDQRRFEGQILGIVHVLIIKCKHKYTDKKKVSEYIKPMREVIEEIVGGQFISEDVSLALNNLDKMGLIAIGQTSNGKELIVIKKEGKELMENHEELIKRFGRSWEHHSD